LRSTTRGIPGIDRRRTGRRVAGPKQRAVGRISIRFAKPHDANRFETDGVVSGPLPPGESWSGRIAKWRVEQESGRRAVLVAEDGTGLVGMVQVIFQFPLGYTDPEVANGRDVAMIESLRTRSHAPLQVLEALMHDAQAVAKRHRMKTVTLCLPLENDRAIVQAKSWGFTEFRLMPEGDKILAFFRKPLT
jgi:hypothetical protein